MEVFTEEDRRQLQALQIGHYIYGTAVGFAFAVRNRADRHRDLGAVAHRAGSASRVVFSFLFWIQAAATFMAARYIQQRRRWMFCVIVGCVTCTWVPIGTVLGAVSILVLARPGVQSAFQRRNPPRLPPPLPVSV